MKQWRIARSLIIVLALVELIVWGTWAPLAIQADTAKKPLEAVKPQTKYQAAIQVNPDQHLVTGSLAVEFLANDRKKTYFHLYPNAFEERPELSQPNWRYVLGDKPVGGKLTIQEVKIEDQPVPFQVHDTILEVPFVREVDLQQKVHARITFQLNLPQNDGRLSYDDHAIWLGNWLPILAIKEAEGWRLDTYYPIGDPFYSDIADYDVQIRVPKEYQVATTGLESQAVITETKPKGVKLYDIQAVNVRDFAVVVMDNSYHSLTSKVGQTLVNTWYREDDDPVAVKRIHDVAQKSLQYYSKTYGTYPYLEYDVVRTGGFFGGMEYPSVVFIQDRYFASPDSLGDAVIAHETAHQWFYGVVGNDEIREAWVDESLTDYSTMAFLETYNPTASVQYIKRRATRAYAAETYSPQGITAWQSVDKFPDWKSYSDLVYSRGATMLWNLREMWGKELVNEALRYYFTTHQYKNATGADVVNAFTHVSGEDSAPYFNYWLNLKLDQEQAAFNWANRGKSKIPASNLK